MRPLCDVSLGVVCGERSNQHPPAPTYAAARVECCHAGPVTYPQPPAGADGTTSRARFIAIVAGLVAVLVIGGVVGLRVWLDSDDEPRSAGGRERSDASPTRPGDGRTDAEQDDTRDHPEPEEAGEPPATVPVDPVTPADRAEVQQRAADASMALFARDWRTYDEDVDAALGFATDGFAADYRATTDDIRDDFVRRRTTTTVSELQTGVVNLDGDTAQVLAVFEVVTERRKSTVISYQVVLTLERDADTWLVADVATGEGIVTRAEPDPEQAAIVDAGHRMAEAFLNLDHRTIDDDQARVLELATGEFRQEYQSSAADLKKLAVQAESVQTVDVLAAGVSESDGTRATVLIAAAGAVTNKQTGGDQPRTYVLELELQLTDGEWLASDLELAS